MSDQPTADPLTNEPWRNSRGGIIRVFLVAPRLHLLTIRYDAILLLPGWKHSPGALDELELALVLDKPVYTDPRSLPPLKEGA